MLNRASRDNAACPPQADSLNRPRPRSRTRPRNLSASGGLKEIQRLRGRGRVGGRVRTEGRTQSAIHKLHFSLSIQLIAACILILTGILFRIVARLEKKGVRFNF
jgi:hypothetical protein